MCGSFPLSLLVATRLFFFLFLFCFFLFRSFLPLSLSWPSTFLSLSLFSSLYLFISPSLFHSAIIPQLSSSSAKEKEEEVGGGGGPSFLLGMTFLMSRAYRRESPVACLFCFVFFGLFSRNEFLDRVLVPMFRRCRTI